MRQILITQRVEYIREIGERRDALSREWALFAHSCGFVPVLAPNHLETVKRILEQQRIDGFLLTGGNDLAVYGGDAPERDELERYLISYACSNGTALAGVCRGMQILMDYFGTPLKRIDGHVRVQHGLDNGDTVNSFHGWGTLECKAPLRPLFRAGDGVIEAVGHNTYENLHGIMWHPERYNPFREKDIVWFKEVFRI